MNGRAPRILLVDDEPVNLRLLEATLALAGYTDLVPEPDPLRVVARCSEAPVDLILLDLNMPVLDGFGVMAALAAQRDPLQPPVLVLTAQRSQEHLLRAFAAGARDFVSKPFDRAELLMRVRNLLEVHLARRMLHERQAVLEEMVAQRTRALRDNRLLLLHKLGRAAEFRDEETGNHILRMSHGAALIARESGWSAAAADMLRNAAPMHDIGKIGIPDHILRKPGRLTPEEWAVMQTHSEIGARLLEGDDGELMAMAREVAWTHHDKWDGSGYPRGLAGQAIPESGRVCALADVFDALLSSRPYKHPWPLPDVVAHIEAQAGRQFDPALVAAFRRCLPELLAIRERFPDAGGA